MDFEGETKMSCKICDIPHKNTGRHDLWSQKQVSRVRGILIEHFSWNGNYLPEYWRVAN